jgi:hypothetical protein
MSHRLAPSFRRVSTTAALLSAAWLVAACGGGGSDPAAPAPGGGGGGGAALTCNTALFQATAVVSLPTAADMAPFAGTYAVDEGSFGVAGFVKSGTASLVVAADGTTTYNGAAVTLTSFCIDKSPAPGGNMIFLHIGQGVIDLFADGTLSGTKPGDITIGLQGTKQ